MPETITTTQTTEIRLNSNDNPLTITSTGGVSVSSSSTAIYGGGSYQIYNFGTVMGGFGIDLHGDGLVSNASTGVIEADGDSIGSTGIALFNGGTIINAGTISASLYGIAGLSGGIVSNMSGGVIEGGTTRLNAGIYIIGAAATVTNDGTISGKYGVILTTGTIENQANGTIDSNGGTFGVKIFGGPGTVTNAGLIEGDYGIKIDGGIVNNLSGGTINGSGGLVGVYVSGAAGTVMNAGVIENTGSKSGFAGIVLGDGGTITNLAGGTITGGDNEPGILIKGGGTVINAGTIGNPHYLAILFSGGGNDRLILDPTSDLHGVVGGGTGSNVLELAGTSVGYIQSLHTFYGFNNVTLDKGAYWDIGGSITNTDTLTMDGKPGATTSLVLVAPNEDSGTISGFTSADAVGLYNEFATGETFKNGLLTLTGAGPNETLAFAGNFTTKDFTLSVLPGGTVLTTDIPCFCAGTSILTTTGEKPVEDIAVGDELITVLPGGPASRKVIWTGRRSIKIAQHAAPALIRPIRIRAGAISPGVPARDLRLSPHHAIYLGGCLFEAQALVNGDTIYQEQNTETVTYHHIELDAHSIILANGLPTETFLDTGNRHMFDNNGALTLHPDFRPNGDADFCAPLIREGALLTIVREKLTQKCKELTAA